MRRQIMVNGTVYVAEKRRGSAFRITVRRVGGYTLQYFVTIKQTIERALAAAVLRDKGGKKECIS